MIIHNLCWIVSGCTIDILGRVSIFVLRSLRPEDLPRPSLKRCLLLRVLCLRRNRERRHRRKRRLFGQCKS